MPCSMPGHDVAIGTDLAGAERVVNISCRPARRVLSCWLLLVLSGCAGLARTSGEASCAAPWLTTVPHATKGRDDPHAKAR